MHKPPENLRNFDALLAVVARLRGPGGCPWDREQTHASLTRFAIEEAFELAEAVDGGQSTEIRDELGDVLLQVVLHAQIAREAGTFDVADVIEGLNRKMIRRHPHVFGSVEVKDSAEVLANWNEIKKAEKPARSDHAFDVPAALPALMRAQKIGEKTKSRAFDWDDADQCWDKVREELAELDEAVAHESADRVEAEFGDVLFSLVQWARHRGIDAEGALRKTNASFEARFTRMREAVVADGREWTSLADADKEAYWKRAKP